MVKNVVAEEILLSYLKKLHKHSFTFGLVLGQPTPNKDYIVHLAKTPYLNKKNDSSNNDSEIENIADFPESWIADHAKHVTRMLPGGMYVLGIFITSNDDVFSLYSNKIKTILSKISKQLLENTFLNGIKNLDYELLALSYNFNSQQSTCKSYENKSNSFKPIGIQFLQQPTKWIQLECNFLFDQIYLIESNSIRVELRQKLEEILKCTKETLKTSLILFDSKIKESNELLIPSENLDSKKKNQKSRKDDDNEQITVSADVLIPCKKNLTNIKQPVLINSNGEMRLIGQMACRVFLHQKATSEEASNAVKEDILRSLAARLEMHSDSLIEEENDSPEENSSVHEPPRRVMIPLPSKTIAFSDYLFPGEGPSEALISLEELLDLSVKEEDVIKDLEIPADIPELYQAEDNIQASDSDDSLTSNNSSRYFYYFGIFFTILVLLLSLIIHYWKNIF